jgi:hypothetical protein
LQSVTDVCYSAEALNIFEKTKICLILCILGDTTYPGRIHCQLRDSKAKENETRSYVSF